MKKHTFLKHNFYVKLCTDYSKSIIVASEFYSFLNNLDLSPIKTTYYYIVF